MDATAAAAFAAVSGVLSAPTYTAAVHDIVYWIMISGGFGGFIHGILRKDDPKYGEYSFILPFRKKPGRLGILGDISVGVAAGVSIFLVIESLFGLRLNEALSPSDSLRLFALGVICGYLGPNLLDGLSLMISTRVMKARETFEKEKDELTALKSKVEKHSRIEKLIFLGDAYKSWGEYQAALEFYDQAADLDSDDPNPLIQKSNLYAKRAKDEDDAPLYERAISYANKALEIDKNSWRAYYNRACYRCLSDPDDSEVLNDLKAAFSIDPDGYIQRAARSDPDFASMGDREEFKKLVESALLSQEKPHDHSNPATPPRT